MDPDFFYMFYNKRLIFSNSNWHFVWFAVCAILVFQAGLHLWVCGMNEDRERPGLACHDVMKGPGFPTTYQDFMAHVTRFLVILVITDQLELVPGNVFSYLFGAGFWEMIMMLLLTMVMVVMVMVNMLLNIMRNDGDSAND